MPPRPDESTYFPADLFQLSDADTFVDCGAFTGDTISQLISHSNSRFETAYAIEADSISYEKLIEFVESLAGLSSKIHPIRVALGAARGVLRFECSGSLTSKASESGALVGCIPIDELFANIPVSMIKMDIEGAEYDAIIGARQTIQRDKPILAICVYHTQNDIWRIPLLMRELLPDHKLYLRAYEGDGFQTVAYAVPPARLQGA